MRTKPKGCEGCPLQEDGLGFCDTVGPKSAKIILIGEGPGENEATFGTPFFSRAPSGWRLDDWLARAGISRSEVLITNVIRCFTVQRDSAGNIKRGNQGRFMKRNPKPKEVNECLKRHLIPEMKEWMSRENSEHPKRVLIPIGQPAQLAILGVSGEKYTGSLEPWLWEEFLERQEFLQSKKKSGNG